MKIILIQCTYILIHCALFTFGAATRGLDTINDDDLIERIKFNEFLITLFCEYN